MKFKLPNLPYSKDSLEPIISKESIEYHYSKHHQTYVTNLNNLIEDTGYSYKNLEDIIQTSSGNIFNNAAQIYNHNFYWNCLSPNKTTPSIEFKEDIVKTFGSFDRFQREFSKVAMTTFGSGWTWLVKTLSGNLEIISTSNADCPLTDNKSPLLTFDVWEHAYYIDYRNARPKYIEALWSIINWDFVSNQFAN